MEKVPIPASVAAERRAGELYLTAHPFVSLILIIFVVTLGQFWFLGFFELFKTILGDREPPWYMFFVVAFALTVLFYVTLRYILNVPVSDLI